MTVKLCFTISRRDETSLFRLIQVKCCLAQNFVRQVKFILLVLVLTVTVVTSSFVIGMNESSCDDLNCTISSQEVRKSH